MTVTFYRKGSAAFVTLDNPPVNAIGLSVRQGLSKALDWIAEEDDLTRVILSGAGRMFAAGADAREFDGPAQPPHLPDIISRIETCAIPWVAVITGVALGGGCELALGCRVRIMSPKAQIGLPEVTLGVIPGAGGTQRLPRVIGMAKAVSMISSGRPISADDAERFGLIEGIADDPMEYARHLDLGTLELSIPPCDMPPPTLHQQALADARTMAARKMAHQRAPQVAIDLVAASAMHPLDVGLAQERAAFLDLRQGDQARALRHVFFAERGARAPADLVAAPADLSHVAVVGGGMMGSGIAYALLDAGLDVTLIEADADGAARAQSNIDRIMVASEARGLITPDDAVERRARLQITQDYADAAHAGLAIEAAFESMDVKASVFADLSKVMSENAIFATNTSYLDLDAISACVPDPSRVIGLHFFAPAHIMKLLEIVRGAQTSERAMATGYALAKRLRKVPVPAGVCDGFIGNRILARYREAADTVLMDGATPWEIDEAMVAFGYAMGPYEAQDLSGLDIAFAQRRRQDATRDPARRYIPIADRMVELGKLGRKTGAGWYRYPGGAGKVDDPIVADLAIEEAHFAGITRRDFEPSEICDRLLCAMVNEAADLLDQGIAASASDIDLVMVHGYGFPRWRGGLMHWAQVHGLDRIVASINRYAEEDALAWQLSPTLEDAARSGGFHLTKA
jgi:3-hydroxyacyl-CoA dehydrogenase